MLLAGIDEAGYGPVLGPLVVALAAFRAPDGVADLWKALSPAVSRGVRQGRLAVADSKAIYLNHDLTALETTALAFSALGCDGALPATIGEFLGRHATASSEALASVPWYGAELLTRELPLVAPRAAVVKQVARLLAAASRARVEIAAIAMRPLAEEAYNRRCDRHGNKAHVLFELNLELIVELERTVPGRKRILCDRHGGRTRYASMLEQVFPGRAIVALGEASHCSRYRVDGEHPTDIEYRIGGERHGMEVALASIFAKYTRELCVDQMNRYFGARAPGIARTAGYHGDGWRYVNELEERGALAPAERAQLVRSR